MKKITANYHEQFLLPPCIEDWVSADHPARFIRELADQLDLAQLGFQLTEPKVGRPPYDERLLLRVWLYGYWKRVASTRKLEIACKEDVGFMFLCGQNAPDHNTLWRFFKANQKALGRLYKQTIKIAIRMDLVGFVVQALDGTKIQGACSGKGKYDKSHLEKRLEHVDQQIRELEQAVEQVHQQEETPDPSLPDQLRKARVLKEQLSQALASVEKEETKYCHPKEPEARRMRANGRYHFGYNAQAVVDEKTGIIVAADVVQEQEDHTLLVEMTKQAVDNTGQKPDTVVADCGYANASQFAEAEQETLNVLVPLPESSVPPEDQPYHSGHFTYEKESDEVICPQGQRLPFRRERIKNKRTGNTVREYRNTAACRECPVRSDCTKSRHGRTIDLPQGYEARQRMQKRLTDPENQKLVKKRKQIVEVVFAWIKEMGGFRRWTVWGVDNVKAQWFLVCSVINLKKIYQAWLKTPGKFDDRMKGFGGNRGQGKPNQVNWWLRGLLKGQEIGKTGIMGFPVFRQLSVQGTPGK
jgi:transposase